LPVKRKEFIEPRWSEYALSVREVPGQYPDSVPIIQADGTWTYNYHQESLDPEARDFEATSRALVANYRDNVPVGVMRRKSGRPTVRYHILGVARVDSWKSGLCTLVGLTSLTRVLYTICLI